LTWIKGRQNWLRKEAVRRQRRTKIDETLVDLAYKQIKTGLERSRKKMSTTETDNTLVDLAYK
jgi:hypothetical protein